MGVRMKLPLARSRSIAVPARVDPRVQGGMSAQERIDVGRLQRDLRSALAGEVRFDPASKALYATDSSNFRQVPIGVVIPRTLDDVVAAHRICHRHRAPILNRGCGTSLSGETVNEAVVIDHSKYLTAIGNPDLAARPRVTVQTGAINEHVNEQCGPAGFIFGPDPSTHAYCTIGGNIGNNSCGTHSVQSQIFGPGPRTADNVDALEVVTYDGDRFWVGCDEETALDQIVAAGGRKGEIYAQLRALRDRYAGLIRARYPAVEAVPRRVSGYNLDELLPERGFNVARALCGTEGTCVTVLQARLLLTPAMLKRALVVVGYPDICAAGDAVPELIRWNPIGLEGLDHLLFEDEMQQNMHPGALSELPDGYAWLLVEFGADAQEEADARAEAFRSWLVDEQGHDAACVSVFEDEEQEQALWQVREGGLGATAFPPDGHDHWPGWEDSAVPPDKVGPYLRDLKALYAEHGLSGAIYGHLGQGCIHSRISFDLRTGDGIARYRTFLEAAADLVVSYGGSLSGEHGDGQQRAELLEKQYGPELIEAMREFKRIWDPDWKMNPGKVVDAYRLDEHLKLGADYNPRRSPTKFSYAEDGFDFAHATVRCVGVGKCRMPGGVEVMCPSFIATQEEMHTTRGRARLLFEMLEGDVVTDGWRSREVKEALDLCLACKGCTSDCPVHVDMPTYKAEFLAHHWARRLRPRHAYAFGFIDQAARVAAVCPEAVNAVTHAPGLRRLAKSAAGMTRGREIPRFAPMTLQAWWRRRGGSKASGPRVVLWPDTFTNHFHTDVGVACVETLEAAGFEVVLPSGHVCCGRPLYDYGFLGQAERYLRRTLDVLRDEVRRGTPIVGMEPSCLAVFKDELTKLLPHDDDAGRLADNAFHLGEFLVARGVEPPKLDGQALLWGHCHHKATGGAAPEQQLLSGMGLDVDQVVGGCCGLAGSWGFEAGHHDLSMEIGEHALLPAVRRASRETLIVANGFSCQTQIEQAGSGRRALHLGQVMQIARAGRRPADGERPEQLAPDPPAPHAAVRGLRLTGAVVGGLAGAAIAWRVVRTIGR